jgi:hypothetical protein
MKEITLSNLTHELTTTFILSVAAFLLAMFLTYDKYNWRETRGV